MCILCSANALLIDMCFILKYYSSMTRRIETKFFKEWAKRKRRAGMVLAVEAGISSGMASGLIRGTYRNGLAPESDFIRESIVKVIGVTEDELFPIVEEKDAA